ncbi:MAG TPA: cytochrome c oxidase assembly protein [Devosia sp.]|jgi:cytochrome c oxidase assembly factor CtaG|nr:cytochrome c oxidase assembly protein [Devosia sp.]
MSLDTINQLILASGCFTGATVAGWTVDPAIIAPLALGGILYLVGLIRLWSAAGRGHGVQVWQAVAFGFGWLAMAVALVTPLHDESRKYFTAHMIEHELVMTVAAPLLVVSRPLPVLLWAFPRVWRKGVAKGAGVFGYLIGWDILSRPLFATVAHAAAIWVWHIPALFDAALGNEFLHWLQHLSFLVTALFFWWAVLDPRQRSGAGVGLIFVTALHTSFLGILLTLARHPIYPGQARVAEAWGADPLLDQQMAGLIMWVPAGLLYVAIGLALAGLWISRSARREAARVRGA